MFFEEGSALLKEDRSALSGMSFRAMSRLPNSCPFGSMILTISTAYSRTPFCELRSV